MQLATCGAYVLQVCLFHLYNSYLLCCAILCYLVLCYVALWVRRQQKGLCTLLGFQKVHDGRPEACQV